MRRFAGLLLLSALVGATGCVPESQYEEARSALDVEQQGHRKTIGQLAAIDQKLMQVEGQLRAREAELAQHESNVSAAQLAVAQAEQKRDEATELVEQLRGELSRVGDHLRAFADDKKRLSAALAAAETKLTRLSEAEKATEKRARVLRDLALLLGEPVQNGDLELELSGARPTLRATSGELHQGPLGKQVMAALVQISKLHPSAKLELSAGAGGTAEAPGPAESMRQALAQLGIAPDRLSVVEPEAPDAAPSVAVIL